MLDRLEDIVEDLFGKARKRIGAPGPSRNDGVARRRGRDDHGRRDPRRAERIAALSPGTRWAVEAEVEYEVDRDAPAGASTPGAEPATARILHDAPHVAEATGPWGSGDALNRNEARSADAPVAVTADGPVPGGGPAFDSATAEVVDDGAHSEKRAGEERSRDRRHWTELWDREGLLSHDGVSLRFQSWDGGQDVEVPIWDLAGRVRDDDELVLTAASYRLKIEDIEEIRWRPAGSKPDRGRDRRARDPFLGLLEDFPSLAAERAD